MGFGVQVSIALVGFAINQESEGAFAATWGTVEVTDFSHFWIRPDVVPTYYEENYRAHLYGETSEFLPAGDPDDEVNPESFMGNRLEILQYKADKGTGKFEYKVREFHTLNHVRKMLISSVQQYG
jgi:hypothetical protein